MKRTDWAEREERSNLPLLRAMTWISLRFGRPVGRAVLRVATVYFVLFSPSARRASRDYLRRVLGRPARWRDVYRHLFTFGATIHDRIYLMHGRFDLFDIRLQGEGLVHAALAAINPAAKPEVIGLGRVDAMLKVHEALDANSMVGMLADRTLLREAGASVQRMAFLGTPAMFPLGPLHMAAVLKRPVLFMTGLYRDGNRYDIHFEALADFSSVRRDERAAAVQAALARYVALLERDCHAAPYNWFNYFDFWQGAETAGPHRDTAPPGADLPATRTP